MSLPGEAYPTSKSPAILALLPNQAQQVPAQRSRNVLTSLALTASTRYVTRPSTRHRSTTLQRTATTLQTSTTLRTSRVSANTVLLKHRPHLFPKQISIPTTEIETNHFTWFFSAFESLLQQTSICSLFELASFSTALTSHSRAASDKPAHSFT